MEFLVPLWEFYIATLWDFYITIHTYFEKKIAEKPYKVVMCAIMRKMVQIIFAVLRNQKSFELRTPEEHQKLIRENSKLAA